MNPFDAALNAIADGAPVAWNEIEGQDRITRGELESLRLLHDITLAFRQIDPSITSPRPPPLFHWGTLEVEQRLGVGSFGEIFRAFDPWLGRTVALKLQRTEPASATRRAEQLEEARRLARIRHPNVLSCYGCAVHDGRAGLWSELIEGRSLARVLADDGALSVEETLRIGRDLARALAAVHAAGLVHGDIKAENVMRERGGRVVLMDFGAGGEERLLAARRLISGTPAYLAPEVLDGEPLSFKTDLYALGALLFLLLTQRMPYTEDRLDTLRAAQHEGRRARLAVLRPDLEPRVADVIERCLDSDPSRRPGDATELAAALAGPPSHVRPADAGQKLFAPVVAAVVVAGLALALTWPRLFPPAWSADAVFLRTRGDTLETLVGDAKVAVGDRLRLRLRSNRTMHVYVLNEDADGHATVLYPLPDIESAVPAREETILPGGVRDAALAWEVNSDSQREEFLVIAALAPIVALENDVASWRRAAAGGAAARSVGALVDDGGGAILQGEHLRKVLADLPHDAKAVRSWRYAFAHTPK